MSPGRKPRRSPASTAGRVRMIRCTLRSVSAAAAIATARKVLPVPAGPIPKVIVLRRIESTYRFWFSVFGATLVLRWRQTTSSRIAVGLSSASSAPATASTVPGTTSWPCSISSTISSTRLAASCRSPGSPSRVSTLPRRWTSTGRRSLSPRRTESSEPASSAATSLSRVSWRRANSATQLLTHGGADPLAVGAPGDLRHHRRHHLAHLLPFRRPGLGDRLGDQPLELLVAQLRGQVILDQLRLEALGGGLLGPPGALVSLGRLDPFLPFPLQDRDLVAFAHLGVLLQRVDDQPQGLRLIPFARFQRHPRIALHLLKNAHTKRLDGGVRRDRQTLGDKVPDVGADERPALDERSGNVGRVVGAESMLDRQFEGQRNQRQITRRGQARASTGHKTAQVDGILPPAVSDAEHVRDLDHREIESGDRIDRIDDKSATRLVIRRRRLHRADPETRVETEG